MSSFEVKIQEIEVHPHPNADLLEVGKVPGMDYQFIVPKGHFKNGDLGVYIPEGAVVPANIISEMNLEGRLAGSERNRVKAIKLRGVLSQGLFYRPGNYDFARDQLGHDVSQVLNIKKYEPTIPVELAGEVERIPYVFPDGEQVNSDTIFRTYTDIENFKKYPNVIKDDELVSITEKLHGTCSIFGVLNGARVVSSKGIAARGLVLKEKENNTYWRAAKEFRLFEKLEAWMETQGIKQALLFGEVLGVQDLMYGLNKGEITFRAFDLYTSEGFEHQPVLESFCSTFGVPIVPVLYKGTFSREILELHTSGKSTLANHIREGVVIRTIPEREDSKLGRVILKSVSEAYLTRKDGTEYN